MSVLEEPYDDNFTLPEKDAFLEQRVSLQKDLEKRQREYNKVVSIRLKNRSEQIIDKSYITTTSRLQSERNDLRAQIYVANGRAHSVQNSRYLALIKCHVRCQEKLTDEIQKLKTQTNHIEHYINSTDKKIYKLNLLTVPDEQHQDFVKQMRKKMCMMENRLEVGVRRQCEFTAANAVLREELKSLLDNRILFNSWFTKLIQKLNTEKKYLVDLIKYAQVSFEDCSNCQEKIINVMKKVEKENDRLKDEMQSKLRKTANIDAGVHFIEVKSKERPVANLQPKEIRRRKKFRQLHWRKINLYNRVLEKLLGYTRKAGEIQSVEGIIEIFTNHENLYYSYCGKSNEIDFHITLLNNAVNQLYQDIANSIKANKNKYESQVEKIAELEDTLIRQRKKNEVLQKSLLVEDNKLQKALNNVTEIFNMCRCNPAPLMQLLGNHSLVSVSNMAKFFKVLQNRVQRIVACVYVIERKGAWEGSEKLVVQDIFKVHEELTDLNDVVLTQQCPECAEGEAFNTDDVGGNDVEIYSKQKQKNLLYEKVNQPEMQYRLHSISQCRLPRSRYLTTKRTTE